jgi:hypothetical protein
MSKRHKKHKQKANNAHHHINIPIGDSPMPETISSSNSDTPSGKQTNGKCECKKKPSKFLRLEADWWIVILTAIIAAAAGASFWALEYQLIDARKNFSEDQRPYVWIANNLGERPNMYVEKNLLPARFAVTVHYTNFGKSPAVRLRWGSEIAIVGKSDITRSYCTTLRKTIMRQAI